MVCCIPEINIILCINFTSVKKGGKVLLKGRKQNEITIGRIGIRSFY